MSPDTSELASELSEAVARDDRDTILRLADEHHWSLMRMHFKLFMEALDRVPDSLLEGRPKLAIFKHVGQSGFLEGGRLNDRMVATFDTVEEGSVSPETYDMILLQEMLAKRVRGEHTTARSIAAALRDRALRPDARARRPAHQSVGAILLHIGITEALAGDLERSLTDFSNAMSLASNGMRDFIAFDAMAKSAVVEAAIGRLRDAERRLEGLGAPPDVGEPFASQIDGTIAIARALLAVDRLRTEAPELVQTALAQNDGAEMWPFAVLAANRWAIATGDLVGAIDLLDRVASANDIVAASMLGRTIRVARALALTLLGEYEAAGRTIGDDDADEDGWCELVRVRLALLTTGPDVAMARARELAIRPGLAPTARAEALLLAAWAEERRLGAPDPATVGPVAVLMAQEGLWRILQLVPDRLAATIPGIDTAPAFERRLVHRDPTGTTRLTLNELEILQLLAGPLSLPAIAENRFVSLNTIKTQVASIYRSLGVHRRREAVAEALRRGLLDAPPH